jgi:alkylhydroperoxidase family enzyme
VAFGVDAGLLQALVENPDAAGVSKKLKPVLAFAKKLTLTPAKMTTGDARAVLDAGWDEQALHDIICVCCIFAFANRLVDGHGVSAKSAEMNAIMANYLTTVGYAQAAA